ncbi:TPA: hypothetical protein ACXJEZ_003533 [Providencia rettgeri]
MKLKLLFSVMAFAVLVSMIIFFVVFLVEKTTFNSMSLTDWSGLFSVFNVLIASSLSFISLIILIVTLRNTQKMTEATFEALVNQKDDNYINQIENLCQRFNQALDKENIAFANDVGRFFDNKIDELHSGVSEWIIKNRVKSHKEVLEHCKSISEYSYNKIDTETDLLLSVLRALSSITDPYKKDIAKAIIQDCITPERRFWFCCMVNENLNHEFFTHISSFEEFMIMSDELLHEVFMQEAMDAD